MDRGARRHQARERALELLYEAQAKDRPVLEVVAEQSIVPDQYCLTLLASAQAHLERAEALISRHSRDWPLDRLAIVDRLVMVLAIGEMLSAEPPPRAVILNEAVELAHDYSTDDSGPFVNGVLAAVARELEGEG